MSLKSVFAAASAVAMAAAPIAASAAAPVPSRAAASLSPSSSSLFGSGDDIALPLVLFTGFLLIVGSIVLSDDDEDPVSP